MHVSVCVYFCISDISTGIVDFLNQLMFSAGEMEEGDVSQRFCATNFVQKLKTIKKSVFCRCS